MYCVYLTIYTGNKLPPFYIGSTSLKKINKGYKGSVMSEEYKHIWNTELKIHPNKFKIKILSFHEKRKDAYIKEEKFHRYLKVNENPLYANKSIAVANGSFGGGFSGKKHTKEELKKMSEASKGKPRPWLKGRKRPDHSDRMLGENNPMYGVKGENHPLYKRKRNDRFCCLFCKKETIKSNLRHHLLCGQNILTSFPS
jgi:hypothetical protein